MQALKDHLLNLGTGLVFLAITTLIVFLLAMFPIVSGILLGLVILYLIGAVTRILGR